MRIDPNTPPQGTLRDWIEHRAEQDGIAAMFPETGDKLTWRALRDHARGLASAITARGVGVGESVAIVMPNGRGAIIALFGALYGGFRATMINLAAGRDAIAYALEHSDAQVALVDPSCRDVFDEVSEVPVMPVTARAAMPLHPVSPETHALLMYTSGTTGRPKGVLHSQTSLLAGGWTTAIAHGLTSQDRGFLVLPIYHINGLCVTVMGALVTGGSFAVTSRFSASRFWDQIAQGGVTWASVVPTIISHVLHGPSAPHAPPLRFIRSASSALARETQTAFETRFNLPIVETMGLTETAAQILSNPMPPGIRKIGSPGLAYGCDVAIHDANGAPLGPEREGEIVVRGPNVMVQYLKNPEATAAAFRGAWHRTGDLGCIDADGYVTVTGRLKELIIKGGENIAPREIDEALYAHPDIVEAAAFGRPCVTYGERVEAAVALREGSPLSAADLIDLCKHHVGAFKAPDQIHFLSELPKGPSGKIQRLKLADLLSVS